jgi:hypothetical protein
MSQSVQAILEQDPADLRLRLAIVLDWYDGPIAGYLSFESAPTAWKFRCIAERSLANDVDDRLYSLSEVPLDLCVELADVLADSHTRRSIIVPSWQFEDPEARAAADDIVARLDEQVGQPELMVRAQNLDQILGCWAVSGYELT